MTDNWNVFEQEHGQKPADIHSERLEPLANELYHLHLEREVVDNRIGQLEAEIARLFPEESGTLSKSAGKYDIAVSRSERWSWDKEALEAQFGQAPLPEFVRRSLTVDKRKFQKLPPEQQAELKHALTRNLDKPKVRISPNV
jgi:hypothetical protein